MLSENMYNQNTANTVSLFPSQYVVPATLVHYARKMTLEHIGMGVKNPFSSPLQHYMWLIAICLWAGVCQIFVTLYLVGKDSY